MSSLSYQSSHEGSSHNLVSYASQEHLVHQSGFHQGPMQHNPMSSSVSVDNIWGNGINGNVTPFQYTGQPNMIARQSADYTGRPLENTGR